MNTTPVGGVYVFVKVTGLDATKETDKYTVEAAFNDCWVKVANDTYAYVGDSGEDTPIAVTDENELDAVFTSVTFDYDNDDVSNITIKPINVIACAVQAVGVDADEAVNETVWQ